MTAPTTKTRCPCPTKKGWNNRSDAVDALHAAWRKGRPGKLPLRVYLCPCEKWHLTSRPLNHPRHDND